jgi:hypothetical protein
MRLKAAIAKIPVAMVLAPTTKVRTAAEILKARGLVEAMGLVAKLVEIVWVSLYNPIANVPAINAPVREFKGLGNTSFGFRFVSRVGSDVDSGVGSDINFSY